MAPLRGSDEGCTCKPKASPWAELGQPFGPKPVCADLQYFSYSMCVDVLHPLPHDCIVWLLQS